MHFIDLDRFKSVNDTLGHDGGDFLLKTVAERLREVIRTDDIVARLGGDEFVIVQTGVKNKDQAEGLAQRLINTVITPIQLRDHTIIATVSVGIALTPDDGTNPERLLKSAILRCTGRRPRAAIASASFCPKWTPKCRRGASLSRSFATR